MSHIGIVLPNDGILYTQNLTNETHHRQVHFNGIASVSLNYTGKKNFPSEQMQLMRLTGSVS